MNDSCINSRTPLRRALVFCAGRIVTRRTASWVPPRMAWRLYGFADWSAQRLQDFAMALEDLEEGK